MATKKRKKAKNKKAKTKNKKSKLVNKSRKIKTNKKLGQKGLRPRNVLKNLE